MSSLNENFKIKNGLTVNTTVSAGGTVEADSFCKHDGTSSQFLKADGSVDSTGYTTCTGTVVAGDISSFTSCTGTVVAGDISSFTSCTGTLRPSGTIATNDYAKYDASGCLIGRSYTEVKTDLGISTAASCTASSLDQSSCAGINCTGDVTGIDAGTAITISDGTTSTPEVAVTAACNTAWNNKTTCTGTVVAGDISSFTSCTGTITCVSTSGEYLTGGGSSGAVNVGIDSACGAKWDTAAAGDISAVTAGTGLCGGGTSGAVTLNICATCNTKWDQSGCAGINCTGTVVAGDISSFTTCTGDITGVTAGNGLSGGGNSGSVTLALDGSCLAGLNQSACAGIDCVGTITGISVSNGITSSGGVSPTLCITTSCQTKFDQSGCAGINCTGTVVSSDLDDLDQSACAGLDCVGTITSVAGLDQSGCAGLTCTGTLKPSGTIATNDYAKYDASGCLIGRSYSEVKTDLGISTAASCTAASLDQSSCAGLNCTGTVVAGDISSFTSCTGDITGVTAGLLLSGGGNSGSVTLGIDSGALEDFNQSSCAGLNCVGTITGISVSNGITSSGGVSPSLCITTSCQTKFDQSGCAGINCTGTVVASDLDDLDQSACAGLDCVGTITSVAGLDQSGCAGLTCTGTLRPSGTIATNDYAKYDASGCLIGRSYSEVKTDLGISTAASCTAASLDQSSCAGINCTGTITSVAGLDQSGCPGLDCVGTITSVAGLDQSGCAGLTCTGTLKPSGTIATNDYAKYNASGCLTGRNCAEVRSDLGINTAASCTSSSLDQSGCAGINCIGTVVAGDISSLTSCTGTVVAGDISSFTSCTGDITGVTAGLLLSGGGTAGSVTLGLDSGALSNLNQSGCAGLNCTGTVVAGDISSFTDCVGVITGISVSNGITTSGGVSPTLCITTSCQTKFDQSGCAGINCTGTVVSSDLDDLDQSACAGLDCVGTITSVAGLDQSGCAGLTCTGTLKPSGTIATNDFAKYNASGCLVGRSCTETRTDLGINTAASCTAASLDQSSCAGLNCTGTVVAGDISSFTSCTGTVVAGDISSFTSCTGDITGVTAGLLLSGGGNSGSVTLGIDSGALEDFNQSGCAGINCTGTVVAGDISSFTSCTGTVVAGDISSFTSCTGTVVSGDISSFSSCQGTTTPSNAQTFTNKGGSNSQWANDEGYTTCSGTLVPADIAGFTECTGTTTPSNSQTFTNKGGSNNQWTNDAGYTSCTGTVVAGDISSFTSCIGDITGVTNTHGLSTSGSSGTICIGIDAVTAAGFNQSGCAGINCTGTLVPADIVGLTECTGTTTPSNAQTFTNKGGSNSQWANDEGYTDCVGVVTEVQGDGSSITVTNGTTDACVGVHADCIDKWNSGGGFVGADGISVFGGTISTCFNGDFQQCIMTNCGSVCLGKCAGKSISEGSGIGNVFLGSCTGCTTSTGDENLALGKQALQQNATGSRNVAIGSVAGFQITGSDNLVFGRASGCGITGGNCNVSIGNYAMRTTTNNSTGSSNTAIGTFAMLKTISGSCNVALGFCSLQNNNTGSKNVALGPCALGQGGTAITGSCNIAVGEAASWKTTTGSNNIAMGFVALGCNSTGSCNVAIGYTAGRFTGTGTSQMTAPTRSIFIGCDATGGGGSATNNEIVIGSGAVGCGSNKAMIGSSSLTHVCSHGTFSTISDKRDKTCICDLEHGLCFIGDLKPKTFNMVTDRDDKEGSISCKRHGFLAQDVLKLEGDDPVIISTDNPDRLGYTGELMIPILVKGMQEQQAIIEDLTSRLKVLEG